MYIEVYSGQVSSGIELSEWDCMYVYSGGIASETTLNAKKSKSRNSR